jgi:Glycosyl transferase family 2
MSAFENTASAYLLKNDWPIDHIVISKSDIAVVIPCYDEDDITTAVVSLANAKQSLQLYYTIIVVVNCSVEENKKLLAKNEEIKKQLTALKAKYNGINFRIIDLYFCDLPSKHAGVGLARKIGMDHAIKIFLDQKADGIITCFDADSQCHPSYFETIITAFEDTKLDAVSINFAHPTDGTTYEKSVYEAIILYELHLRYYIQIQECVGLPYAMQTIGSSMAVRGSSYCRYGGMNKHKAGEDFYFLQKFISKGQVTKITNVLTFPSPRVSNRVPFGTGKAVGSIMKNEKLAFETYHPDIFILLKSFIDRLDIVYDQKRIPDDIPMEVKEYFESLRIEEKLKEIFGNTSSLSSFKKRFFMWFDAFALMKYVHYMRDNFKPNIDVNEAVDVLLMMRNNNYCHQSKTPLLRLEWLREWDREP